MSRLLKASLMAPLMVTLLLTFVIIAFFPQSLKTDEGDSEMFIAVISAGILLMTNFMTFFIGAPYYYMLQRKDLVSATTIIGGGVMFGCVVGTTISAMLQYTPGPQMLINIGVYAMIGSSVSACIWHYGLRPLPEKNEESAEPKE